MKSSDRLVQIYLQSVGRNSKLLLNVPPTPGGLLHDVDVERLTGMRTRVDRMFGGELRPGRPARVAWVRLSEDITHGQSVAACTVSGFDGSAWLPLSRGTTIGHARIDRIDHPGPVSRVRVEVTDAEGGPGPVQVRAFVEN